MFGRIRIIIALALLVTSGYSYSRENIFMPTGINWGSFTISPLFESENEYDSNIFKTSRKEQDDFIFHLKPSLNIHSNWSRHALDFTVRGDIGLHEEFVQEDFEDIFIDLSGRLDVLKNSYASTKFYWSQNHEERGDIENGGINGPTEYEIIGGVFAYEHLFNRLKVNVSNDIQYIDYDDSISSLDGFIVRDDLRNRYVNVSVIQLSYDLNPRLDFFIRGTYNFKDYDSNTDRSSTIPGLVGFNRDSEGFEISAGSSLDFTGVLFGDMHIGYREQYYDDSNLDDIKGITGGVGLKWLATPLTTVALAIDNDILETTQVGVSGGVISAFKVNVYHELLRYVLLNAHVNYSISDYEGSGPGLSSREDEIFLVGVNFKYILSRNVYIKGDYLYKERESNIPLNDYESHRFILSLGLQM